eukprot:16221-Pleurochrysis_carterae.AAC.1
MRACSPVEICATRHADTVLASVARAPRLRAQVEMRWGRVRARSWRSRQRRACSTGATRALPARSSSRTATCETHSTRRKSFRAKSRRSKSRTCTVLLRSSASVADQPNAVAICSPHLKRACADRS